MIQELPLFLQIKTGLVAVAGVTADAMHIYLGILCYLTSIAVTKSPLKARTLVPVFLVAVLAEIFDLYYDSIGTGVLRFTESVHDVVNTCLVPILMFGLVRLVVANAERVRDQRAGGLGGVETPPA